MVLLVSLFLAVMATTGVSSRSRPKRQAAPTARRARWRPLTEVSSEPGYSWATARWLRTLIYDGHRLPHAKLGGRVMVDLNEIDDLIEQNRSDEGPA